MVFTSGGDGERGVPLSKFQSVKAGFGVERVRAFFLTFYIDERGILLGEDNEIFGNFSKSLL